MSEPQQEQEQEQQEPPRKKYTGNFGSRAAFAGRDHDEQLHDGVIDPWATGLDDEDILLPDTLEDLDTRLALLR